MENAYVYILRCADNTLYTGWTTDVLARLSVHNAKNGAKYTKCRLPVVLVYKEKCINKSHALKREYEIKQLTKLQKQKLIDEYTSN